MKHKTKLAKERAGAYQMADRMCEALDKFPKNEQDARIKKIPDIVVTDRISSPKRASTPAKSPRSRPAEAPQRKRAHR